MIPRRYLEPDTRREQNTQRRALAQRTQGSGGSQRAATGVAGPRAGSWIESYPRTRVPGVFRGTRVTGCSRSILRVAQDARSSFPAYLCASALPAFRFSPRPLLPPVVAPKLQFLKRQHQAAGDTSLLSASFVELQVEQVQPQIGAHAHGPDQSLRPGAQRTRETATNVEEVTGFN